jgi:hypothetical protein
MAKNDIMKRVWIIPILIGIILIAAAQLGMLSTIVAGDFLRTDGHLSAPFVGFGGYGVEAIWNPEPYGGITRMGQISFTGVKATNAYISFCGKDNCLSGVGYTITKDGSFQIPLSGSWAYAPSSESNPTGKAIFIRVTKADSAGPAASLTASKITIDYQVDSCIPNGAGTTAACTDGKDNNCNKIIDESYEGLNCALCPNVGCTAGAEQCKNGQAQRCVKSTCTGTGTVTNWVAEATCTGNFVCQQASRTPYNNEWYTNGIDAKCVVAGPVCGDSICSTGETCANDCFKCGDGACTSGKETTSTCPGDCKTNSCPNPMLPAVDECHTMKCDASTGFMVQSIAVSGCTPAYCGDGKLQTARFEQCECKVGALNCIAEANWAAGFTAGFECKDCYLTPVCGDGKCLGNEASTCPKDCAPPQTCGNGIVEGGEVCDISSSITLLAGEPEAEVCSNCQLMTCSLWQTAVNNECVDKTCAADEALNYMTGACDKIPTDCKIALNWDAVPCEVDKYYDTTSCSCLSKCAISEKWSEAEGKCVIDPIHCPEGQQMEMGACVPCPASGCDITPLPDNKLIFTLFGGGCFALGVVLFFARKK